ncbi:helix-turn-helix domain-containing protein [Thermoactinomyces daqus]|uniref:Helix-turn-helix domain-containing protein n=1 Tax=Thermoactinomyces daqus TaxID=1329516 RepID=A0A7W1X8F5_9BACL|nr:phBC6A51 family helix-turn-helix protein [Thermoactinomyces daqus]MBA4542013.1 helix-turn-helix domain-containing protein [Thermoactinomyces daqus]
MAKRGRKPDLTKLSAEQIEAAMLLADPHNKMTQREVAQKVGVHYNSVWNWLHKNEDFRDLIEYYRDQFLNDLYGLAIKALETQLKRNNTRAVEIFLKSQGKLTERHEVEQTIEDKRDSESLEAQLEKLKRELDGAEG